MAKKSDTIEKLATLMVEGFSDVEKRFDSIDERFKEMDGRFDIVDAKLEEAVFKRK